MPGILTDAQRKEIQTLIRSEADALTRGQIPGFGSGMNDTYTASDNVDAPHPLNIRYVIASNTQRLTSARLSFHLASYRTYSNFTATGTSSDATGESGHGHSHTHGSHGHSHTHGNHNHTTIIGAAALAQPLSTDGAGNIAGTAGPNAPAPTTNTTPAADATGTTPSADASASSGHNHSHSHTVSGASFLGVFTDITAAGLTITFDGVDQTAALGGPWSVDVVELDVRPFISTTVGVYHTIALTPTGLGRIEAHLRLGAYVDARLTV